MGQQAAAVVQAPPIPFLTVRARDAAGTLDLAEGALLSGPGNEPLTLVGMGSALHTLVVHRANAPGVFVLNLTSGTFQQANNPAPAARPAAATDTSNASASMSDAPSGEAAADLDTSGVLEDFKPVLVRFNVKLRPREGTRSGGSTSEPQQRSLYEYFKVRSVPKDPDWIRPQVEEFRSKDKSDDVDTAIALEWAIERLTNAPSIHVGGGPQRASQLKVGKNDDGDRLLIAGRPAFEGDAITLPGMREGYHRRHILAWHTLKRSVINIVNVILATGSAAANDELLNALRALRAPIQKAEDAAKAAAEVAKAAQAAEAESKKELDADPEMAAVEDGPAKGKTKARAKRKAEGGTGRKKRKAGGEDAADLAAVTAADPTKIDLIADELRYLLPKWNSNTKNLWAGDGYENSLINVYQAHFRTWSDEVLQSATPLKYIEDKHALVFKRLDGKRAAYVHVIGTFAGYLGGYIKEATSRETAASDLSDAERLANERQLASDMLLKAADTFEVDYPYSAPLGEKPSGAALTSEQKLLKTKHAAAADIIRLGGTLLNWSEAPEAATLNKTVSGITLAFEQVFRGFMEAGDPSSAAEASTGNASSTTPQSGSATAVMAPSSKAQQPGAPAATTTAIKSDPGRTPTPPKPDADGGEPVFKRARSLDLTETAKVNGERRASIASPSAPTPGKGAVNGKRGASSTNLSAPPLGKSAVPASDQGGNAKPVFRRTATQPDITGGQATSPTPPAMMPAAATLFPISRQPWRDDNTIRNARSGGSSAGPQASDNAVMTDEHGRPAGSATTYAGPSDLGGISGRDYVPPTPMTRLWSGGNTPSQPLIPPSTPTPIASTIGMPMLTLTQQMLNRSDSGQRGGLGAALNRATTVPTGFPLGLPVTTTTPVAMKDGTGNAGPPPTPALPDKSDKPATALALLQAQDNPPAHQAAVAQLAGLGGIPNNRNDCYLAAVMQLVAAVPAYRNLFNAGAHQNAESLHLAQAGRYFLARMQANRVRLDDVTRWREALVESGWLVEPPAAVAAVAVPIASSSGDKTATKATASPTPALTAIGKPLAQPIATSLPMAPFKTASTLIPIANLGGASKVPVSSAHIPTQTPASSVIMTSAGASVVVISGAAERAAQEARENRIASAKSRARLQQDAQELLNFILNKLGPGVTARIISARTTRNPQNPAAAPVDVPGVTQPANTLSLPGVRGHGARSIEALLDANYGGQTNDDEVRTGPNELSKFRQNLDPALPPVLTLHAGRFLAGGIVKANERLEGAETLIIPTKVSQAAAPVTYHLRAFIVHRGAGIGAGHYVAYRKQGNNWVEFDDEAARPIPATEAQNAFARAYLMTYEQAG